jgi:hypothetical protein
LLKVSRSQWRGAGFKPGKHCVNKLLLWHNIDCPFASRHPVTNALNELAASLIVAGLTPPEDYNSLIARNTGFSLSELIDGRAGAASEQSQRDKQRYAENGSAMPFFHEFDQAPAPYN